jgi:AraC-like DNA-binding protein
VEYEELAPPTDLASLVRCFWRLTRESVDTSDPSVAEPALPDGSPELIFVLADPFEHVGASGAVTQQPRAFLVGQITAPMTVRPTGRIDLLAVRFESHGASILHPMLRLLTNHWVDVTQLGLPTLRSLGPTLAATPSVGARVQLAAQALRHIADRSPRPDPRVASAVRIIRERHGAVALDALADSLALAPRTLQRLFAEQVGITPKHLARIVRFQRVFAAWRHDPGSLARVAAECGYFDQSHLVRDFRDLAGMPPATFLTSLPTFTGLFLP